VDSGGLKEACVIWGGAHWHNLANTTEMSMLGAPAKRAEPIAKPFGVWTLVDPRNCVLDGVLITPCQGAIFRGKDMPGHA